MRLLACLSLISLLSLPGGVSLRGDEKGAVVSGESDGIGALVAQLGNPEYAVREAAGEKLSQMGLAAFSALEKGAAHPDREVRYRAIRILGVIRESDLQRRLEAFLEGKLGEGEVPLPGWRRFEKTYGDDPAARQLFVEMQRADAEMLGALESGTGPAIELLGQRTLQYQQGTQPGAEQLSLGQVAAMLFVAAEEDVKLPIQTMSLVLQHCNQQTLREAIRHPAKQDVPRQMVGALVKRSEDWSAYQAMKLAVDYELDEGLVPALRILNKPEARAPHMTQHALMTLAKLGDDSHLPLIESLLDDRSVITQLRENDVVTFEVQVRDAALATAILLTKQELDQYFLARGKFPAGNLQQIYFNARRIGFADENQRTLAQKKWAEYANARRSARRAGP